MPSITSQCRARMDAVETVFLRTEEVAKMIGKSPGFFMRLVKAGLAPQPVRLGGAVLFKKEAILRWIADACPPVRSASDDSKPPEQ